MPNIGCALEKQLYREYGPGLGTPAMALVSFNSMYLFGSNFRTCIYTIMQKGIHKIITGHNPDHQLVGEILTHSPYMYETILKWLIICHIGWGRGIELLSPSCLYCFISWSC